MAFAEIKREVPNALDLLPALQTLRLEICGGMESFEEEVDRNNFVPTEYFEFEIPLSAAGKDLKVQRRITIDASLLLRCRLYSVDTTKDHYYWSIQRSDSNLIFYRARPSADPKSWRGLELQTEWARPFDLAQMQGVHEDWAQQREQMFQGELPYTERIRAARKTDEGFYHLRHPMAHNKAGWEH